MDDQPTHDPSAAFAPPPPPSLLPPPPPSGAIPPEPDALPGAAPVQVTLPGGPPSPWSPGAAGGQVPPSWYQADQSYVVARPASRRPRRLAAVVASVALVAGGLATTAVVLRQRPAAQPTPEAAVQRFLGALEDRDLLGAAETLAPAERALVVDLLADWRDTGVSGVPTDGDLQRFDAYTLTLDDLTTVTQPVTADIAVVELTGGRYTASADVTKLPFGIGSFAAGITDDLGGEPASPRTTSGDLADSEDPPRLATVRDGDGWHVSLMYTVAEAARLSAGLQAPDPARRIADKGAASPDAAVREMVDAGSRGDWRRMIELTSPGELAVLHDYGPLLLENAPPAPVEPWFTVTDLTFDRKSARNSTILTVKSVAGTATLDGRTASLKAEQTSAGCFHVLATMDGEEPIDRRGCADDGFGQAANDQLTPELRDQFAKLQQLSDDIGGIAVVEVDGLWYVSPVRTVGRLVPAVVLGIDLFASAFRGAVGATDDMDPGFGAGADDPMCFPGGKTECDPTGQAD